MKQRRPTIQELTVMLWQTISTVEERIELNYKPAEKGKTKNNTNQGQGGNRIQFFILKKAGFRHVLTNIYPGQFKLPVNPFINTSFFK